MVVVNLLGHLSSWIIKTFLVGSHTQLSVKRASDLDSTPTCLGEALCGWMFSLFFLIFFHCFTKQNFNAWCWLLSILFFPNARSVILLSFLHLRLFKHRQRKQQRWTLWDEFIQYIWQTDDWVIFAVSACVYIFIDLLLLSSWNLTPFILSFHAVSYFMGTQ